MAKALRIFPSALAGTQQQQLRFEVPVSADWQVSTTGVFRPSGLWNSQYATFR